MWKEAEFPVCAGVRSTLQDRLCVSLLHWESDSAWHDYCQFPEGARFLLHQLGSLMQQEAEMQVLWRAISHCAGSTASMAHSVTILCPGSREPWARQIPAPRFGSSVLPPRGLSDTVYMFDIFCLSTPYSDVPPLEIFLQCYLTLASRCSTAFLAGCCWHASTLLSSVFKSFSDHQGMTRTVLIAFQLRLYVSGQATCLYCIV